MNDLQARSFFEKLRLEFGDGQMLCPKCAGNQLYTVATSPTTYECQGESCRPNKKKAGYRFTLTSRTLLHRVSRLAVYLETANLIFVNRYKDVSIGTILKKTGIKSRRLADAARNAVYYAMQPKRVYTRGYYIVFRLGRAHIALEVVGSDYRTTRRGKKYPSKYIVRSRCAAYHINHEEAAGFLLTFFCPPAGNFYVSDVGFAYTSMGEDPRRRNHTGFPRVAFLSLPQRKSYHYAAMKKVLDQEESRYKKARRQSKHKNYGNFLCEYVFHENILDQHGRTAMARDINTSLVAPIYFDFGYPISRPPGHAFPPHRLWPKGSRY